MRRLSRLPWHPLLLGAWIVLSAQVSTGVHLQATLRAWGAVLAIATLALAVWLVVTRRPHMAGIGGTATVWLLASREIDRFWLGLLGIGAALGAFVIVRRLARGRLVLSEVTPVLNVVGLLLVGVALVQGIGNGSVVASAMDLFETRTAVDPAQASSARQPPDIYLVILDGYPRADVLDQVSGMDNTPFLDELRARNFTVATQSRSSYMYSDLMATALFHGRHLVDIDELQPLFDGEDRPALARRVLNQAPLVERLRELGYVTIANAQAWDEPSLRNVDVYIEGSGFNEFERHMWWNSLPGSLMELRGPVVYQDGIEPWVHDGFGAFEEVAAMDIERPRFAFIHIPSPHLPIIFEADGSRADSRFGRDHPSQIGASAEEIRAAYAGQIAYLNRRVIETLDAANPPENAVVVLISDHGPEFGLDWFDGLHSDLPVRFGAFFAARAPAGTYDDDANVVEALLQPMRNEGLTDQPPLDDRFFVTNAGQKLATMTEVPDPWATAN